MPLVYADTSALFAYFHPRDEFSLVVTEAARNESPDFAYWSFMRYELRHNIRQSRVDSHGEVAWRALRAAEKTQTRFRWQQDLKCESLLDSADEFSAQRARHYGAGSADFLHVVAARRLFAVISVKEFWTCDADQADLARAAGLPVRQFESKRTRT